MLADYWEKYDDAPVTVVAQGVERRLIHTGSLMLAVVDFYDGPTTSPDPFHLAAERWPLRRAGH